MKNAILGLAVVIGMLIITSLFQRPWPGVAIELNSCQPDGVRAKLHRAWDPRGFWVEQHVTLEFALRDTDLRELIEDCGLKESNSEKREACEAFYVQRHRKLQRCFASVAAQCRREGGLC